MHAVSTLGDALVAVALAGTLFFAVPVAAARPRVALYLLLTVAPFAVVAPLLGLFGRDLVVPRAYAEWCGTLDLVIGLSILLLL